MREIKFRVWDEQIEEFLYFGLVNDNQNLVEDGCFGQGYIEKNAEQYTGLKDCKRTEEFPEGQDIYEGDVVKSITTGIIFQIVFDEKQACFHGDNRTIYNLRAEMFCKSEIIGNIHEEKK